MAGSKRVIFGVLSFAVILGSAGIAQAANPKLAVPSTSVNNSGALLISVRATGLGNIGSVEIKAGAEDPESPGTARADAVWGCVNKGGQIPNAENKRSSGAEISVSDNFSVTKNGSVRGTLTVAAPGPESGFRCPGGQRLELLSVTYSDIFVSWDKGDENIEISAPTYVVSRIFFQ
jgi:hypothetical protein